MPAASSAPSQPIRGCEFEFWDLQILGPNLSSLLIITKRQKSVETRHVDVERTWAAKPPIPDTASTVQIWPVRAKTSNYALRQPSHYGEILPRRAELRRLRALCIAAASQPCARPRIFKELRQKLLDVLGELRDRDIAVAILVAMMQGIDDGRREDAVAGVFEFFGRLSLRRGATVFSRFAFAASASSARKGLKPL
jgi:hypothetical protein